VLGALDWVLTNRSNAAFNIKVVNMSLGTAAVDSYTRDPLCLAVRKLSDAGIVVVAAAGNEGKDGGGGKLYGQIHAPGNDPSVITVGASNSFGTDGRADDAVATYSSRGPTRSFWTGASGVKHYDNLIKPDLVAPGNRLIAAQAAGNYLVSNHPDLDANVSGSANREQMYLSGSSMATPVVAGAAALLKQANPSLTPNLIKMILMYTAQPLAGFNQFEQGAGLVNLEGAMRLARLVRTDLSAATPVGAPLLCATCAEPAPVSTIDGQQFYWGRGLILDNTFATGSNLILKYQAVYGLGTILSDATPWSQGVVMGDGVTLSEGTILSDGVTFSESILTSNGTTLDAGSIFCGTGVIISDGVMLTDGTIMADGGRVLGDGVVLGDAVLLADVHAQAALALVKGDDTPAMSVALDGTPSDLKATAASKTQLNLTWADNALNETGYRVERSANGVTFTPLATLGANATSYANAGLTANTRYYYRVQAFNSRAATKFSNTANATTPRK
jgi:subtilisin family serine protease